MSATATTHRTLVICPRGFANEISRYALPAEGVDERADVIVDQSLARAGRDPNYSARVEDRGYGIAAMPIHMHPHYDHCLPTD